MRVFLILLYIVFAAGCADPGAVLDRNVELPGHNWSYANKLKYDIKIDDETALYNLYFNLRVTGGYKYSNIFVIFNHGKGKTRYEFKLANPDGEWLGAGAGNLYAYRFPLRTQYKFPAKGTYHFEIEQNMRDNPLHEVSDAGLRVESEIMP
ncbi:MAG: gliding motility lipoprotein GldH [Mucilaginibacter sp.]